MRCVVGLMLGLVLTAAVAAPTEARHAQPGGFRIAVTSWFACAKCTTMRGVLSGDVVGTLAGAALGFRPAAKGAAFQTLHDRYVIRATRGARSFVAVVSGRRNRATGATVLDGLVTEGWQKGAQVHVALRKAACAQSAGGCLSGTIRVR